MTDYVWAWDCRYCGTNKIWGYNRCCTQCGKPRGSDTKFYKPSDAPLVTPEMKKFFDGGADWYCEHCDSSNEGNTDKCEHCGAARGKSQQHTVRVYKGGAPSNDEEIKAMEPGSTVVPQRDYVSPDDPYNPPLDDHDSHSSSLISEPTFSNTDPYEPKTHPSWLKVVVISLAVIALAVLGFLFFNSHKVPATVSGFAWSQTVHIEEYQTFHEEGWSVPFGGRITGQETRQSGTRTVTDGYRNEPYTDTCYKDVYVPDTCDSDNGNGSGSTYACGGYEPQAYSCTKTRQVPITHQEPVYDTWYFYDIDRWVVISDHPTSGNNHKPYYDPAQPVGNLQRRVEVPGTYTVYFRCDEVGDFDKDYDLEKWLTFDYGQEHTVKTNIFKTILSVE